MQDGVVDPGAIFGEEDARILAALDVERYNRESVYAHPGFRPVRAEHTHAPVRVAAGALPADLEGVYLRNGTNVQFDRPTVRAHAFNGAGMLHQVQIAGGRATYSNTYLRTPRYEYEQAAGREVFPGYGDMACSGAAGLERIRLIKRKQAEGRIPKWSSLQANPASTSVQYHHGRLYCLQGSGWPFVLDARFENDRLMLDGTGRLQSWDGRLTSPFSAHPRVDPVNGDFYNIAVDGGSRSLWMSKLANGELAAHVKIDTVAADRDLPGTIHDYFLTEHYLVIPDVSLRYAERHILGPGGSFWHFEPSFKLRWGVLPRDFKPGDTVQWFETGAAGMVWHVVNAWEEPGPDGKPCIQLYAPVFADYPANVPIHTPEEPHAHLTHWTLDLTSGRVVEERRLLEHGYERPSLNLDYVGRRSRYAYLLDEEADGYMGKGVLKYDLIAQKEAGYFSYGEFHGGEALFVPRAHPGAEDDGYLLDLLMAGDSAQLLVLDAATLSEVARLQLPARVPFGVHACWLDAHKLQAMRQG